MEVRFCDICNESVPQGDLDAGRAFVRKGRIVCASCDLAMSPRPVGSFFGVAGDGEPQTDAFAAGAASTPRGARSARRERGDGLGLWVACMALAGVAAATWLADRGTEDLRVEERVGRLALEQQIGRLRAQVSARQDRLEAGLSERLESFDEAREMDRAAAGARSNELLERQADLEQRLSALEAGLEAALTRIDSKGASPGAPDAAMAHRIDALESDLSRLQEDMGVLVRSMLEGLGPAAPGPSSAAPAPVQAAAWQPHLAGLEAEDALERWDAIQALAASGDPAVGPHLAMRLSDEDLFVRMAAARALGELGSSDAVPALIDALGDAEASVREAAVLALRTLTGRSFRFDPAGTPGDRARRAAAWRDWWQRSGGQDRDS